MPNARLSISGGILPPQDALGVPPPESRLHVTERSDRSLKMHMLHLMIKPINSHVIKPRKIIPPGSPRLNPTKRARKQCAITERTVNGIYVYDVVPLSQVNDFGDGDSHSEKATATPAAKARKRIYYFAGGGWQMIPSGEHWALVSELACRIPDTTVTLVSYPLAPKSPAPVAFPLLQKVYLQLLSESAAKQETVVLGGDSAGGNIALCLATSTLCASEENLAPTAIMAISPSTDLRRHNPQIKVIEKHDPLLKIAFINSTAKAWCGGTPTVASDPSPNANPAKSSPPHTQHYSGERWDPGDPRVSPIRADLRPLARKGVKVHGVTGTYDILSPDAVLFREKCRQAGIEGEWLDWDKQMHCFPLAFSFNFKESVEAVDWIIDTIAKS